MNNCNPNHPFVVWAACFLWIVSIFSIACSLLLFFCLGDMLYVLGTDIVNAVVLLSGIIMLPTNIHILCNIAYGKKIDHKSKVVCCPMWLCIIWIMAINCLGAALCIYRIYTCRDMTRLHLISTIKHYRNLSKHKHFIDNLQWSLRCCGYNSYKDWFNYDWYDKIRDYEWEPYQDKRHADSRETIKTVTDSVPLSCCKSGSCISNYLLELGTGSIHTRGCGDLMYHIILYSMIIHLVMFISVIAVEELILVSGVHLLTFNLWAQIIARLNTIIYGSKPIQPNSLVKRGDYAINLTWGLILYLITPRGFTNVQAENTAQVDGTSKKQSEKGRKSRGSLALFNVKHIMPMKDNYSASSASLQLNPDDSDEFDRAEQMSLVPRHIQAIMEASRTSIDRHLKKTDDECPDSPEQHRKWSNHK